MPSKNDKATPEVTKRRVTMRSTGFLGDGTEAKLEIVDYVRPDFLDEDVADARQKYQFVEVSDEPDAGPGGYHGQTHVPAHLNHPLAGQTFAATNPED